MGGLTYLVLCAVFIALSATVTMLAAWRRARRQATQAKTSEARPRRQAPLVIPTILAAVVLLVLTAVFDNVMIAVGLFSYAEDVISGVRIGLAPIEDFAYPVAGALLLPSLWVLLEPLQSARSVHDR